MDVIVGAIEWLLKLFGISLSLRDKNGVRIDCKITKAIPLLTRNLSSLGEYNIKVFYNNNEIEKNLIFFQVEIRNASNKDMIERDIVKNVNAELPDNLRWVEFRLINNDKIIEATLDKEKNSVTFYWDLFKRNENVRFEALIEDTQGHSELESFDEEEMIEFVADSISFSHRVYNLRKVTINIGQVRKEVFHASLGILFAGFFAFILFWGSIESIIDWTGGYGEVITVIVLTFIGVVCTNAAYSITKNDLLPNLRRLKRFK